MDARPPAIFINDSSALNFLNSIATPVDKPVDWINDGEGLLAWLEQANLVPAEALQAIRAQALPGELDRVADQARNLREWFRGFVQRHLQQHNQQQSVMPDTPMPIERLEELEPLNRLLERDEAYSRIVRTHHHGRPSLELQSMRRWRSPEALLLPIAEELARLVCSEDFSNVKACQGSACTLLFADHTRGRARRWCSMAICGNRAKQSAHRQRIRQND